MSWVFEQDIPSRAKTVLLALANHADHVTGHCFPSIDTIMKEASCSRQGVFNFIGLLQRNGFIDKKPRLREDGTRRSSDYWLLFDRAPAKWISSFKEENSPDGAESEETEGEGTHSGLTENAIVSPPCVPPESAPCTAIYEPSDSNRQNLESKDRRALKIEPPKEFSSQRRLEQKTSLQAAEEARKPKMVPVIEGSEPWKAWVRHGHPPTLVNHIELNGKRHRGRYFPSLYPPKATGPPAISGLMTPEDEEHFRFK